jgi:MoaA/NifB/PqqE/SkfB family radical SAM enzyme
MIPKSNEIRVETTTKCNYNCIICPRDRFLRKKETMTLEKFRMLFDKIISETPQYDTVTFSGFGEPLLDPTLNEKIRYVKQKNFNVLILSNGSLLTVHRFKELESLGVNSIRISLYGMSPSSYSLVHGLSDTTKFEKIMHAITQIAKIKKTTRIILTYNVIDGVNSEDTEKWIEYWEDRVDLIEVWKPHNWVDGRNCRVVQEEKLNSCGRPWTTPLQVQVDGTVNMCCFDYNGKLLLGDLNTQSLHKIFSSKNYKKIEYCHTTGDFASSNLICENCDQRNKNKSDVMVHNSRFKIKDRVGKVSTTYSDLL